MTSEQTIRAVGVQSFGGPEQLQELSLPQPHPGSGQVRVAVHAAGINAIDRIVRIGAYGSAHDSSAEPPFVPGTDISGVIDELGTDLPDGFDLAVGDRVVGFVVPDGTRGGYAEEVVLPAASVVRAPKGLDHVQAASFLMNAVTAFGALRALDLQPGQTLGVTGAAGAVGGYLVQLAHQRGLRVIAQAGAADTDLVKGFGADVVVDRDSGADGFLAVEPSGLDAIADPASLRQAVVPAVKDGGRLAIFLPWQGDEPGRGIRVWHNNAMRDAQDTAALDELARLVEAGKLDVRVEQVYPLAQAAQAHQRLEQGHLRGRLMLRVRDDG